MPTITFRVTADEKVELEALASREGFGVSELVRRALKLQRDAPDASERLEAVERRLARLEELAGL
jgi:hypothetical protein